MGDAYTDAAYEAKTDKEFDELMNGIDVPFFTGRMGYGEVVSAWAKQRKTAKLPGVVNHMIKFWREEAKRKSSRKEALVNYCAEVTSSNPRYFLNMLLETLPEKKRRVVVMHLKQYNIGTREGLRRIADCVIKQLES